MDVITLFLIVVLFLLGVSAGSFVLAMVWRLHNNIPIFLSRSCCDKCGHQLSWYELIPLLSYWIWRRRCRHCKERLSSMHFFVELFVGLAFVGIFIASVILPEQCSVINSACVNQFYGLIALFLVLFSFGLSDALYLELPDMLTFPVIIFLVFSVLLRNPGTLGIHAISVAVAAGFFGVQWLLSKGRWIGSGDIILGVVTGLLLPWQLAIIAIGLAYIVGAVVAVVLVLANRLNRGDVMPLGALLSASTFIVVLMRPFFEGLL